MLITFSRPKTSSERVPAPVYKNADGEARHQLSTSDWSVTCFGSEHYFGEISQAISNLKGGQCPHVQTELPGCAVLLDHSTSMVYLIGDLLSSYPMYWAITGSGLLVSNRLSEIAALGGWELDPLGLIEFLRFGYFIGNRTLFSHVQRVEAGQEVSYCMQTNVSQASDRSPLWAEVGGWRGPQEVIDRGSEMLVQAARSMKDGMLMMSGGWDSRTLLAGALGGNYKPVLYNHGEIDGRETRIVSSIASDHSIRLITHRITAEAFSPIALSRDFQRYDNVIFPHWHEAGEIAQREQVQSVSAGIFGEVLGGHYGPPMLAKGHRKIAALLSSLLSAPAVTTDESPDGARAEAFSFLAQTQYSLPWYFDEDAWAAQFSTLHEAVNDDLQSSLSRYSSRGVMSAPSLIEAFITEHRGGQYIGAQLQSAAQSVAFAAPFAHRSFIRYACSVPFGLKVHNVLNRRLIQRVAPSLLNYPMAATLCRSSRPILIQEASRVIRKLAETGQWKLHRTSRGRVSEPKLSWVNYQFLHDGAVFNDLIESLRSPLFNKSRMRSFVANHPVSSYHPLMDMLLKIKTVDMLLSNGE